MDDFNFVCSKIDGEREVLNCVSQEIWKTPELLYEEFHAHGLLSNILEKYGFKVQRNYVLDTAFRAEHSTNTDNGPTIAILLEYDALPEIGHACGHNLIAEAGLATAVAIKEVMDKDFSLSGKLIVMGTPAEESGGGKIRLLDKGAFDDIDVALMVHPTSVPSTFPLCLCNLRGEVKFKGKEAHAAASPWEGKNALDAAVACYNNLSLLRQQIKPMHRIHAIITEGGLATNIIPGRSCMKISIRTPTVGELHLLRSRVENCIKGAASSTGCTVEYSFDEAGAYQNLISNKILGNIFQENYDKLEKENKEEYTMSNSNGSTDMGNVSHVIPVIHPFYVIPTKDINHTKGFTAAVGEASAQDPTLNAAKALALTALAVFRSPYVFQQVKEQFAADIVEDLKFK